MIQVVAFNGSPRPHGNTAQLIQRVFSVLEAQGIQTELVSMAGHTLPGCRACYGCAKRLDRRCIIDSDPVNAWIEKMLSADGIILASPTYFSDVTTEMKALMDRAGLVARVNGDLLQRKVGAAVVAVRRAGGMHAFDTLNHFFTIGQMIIPGSSYWNLGMGRNIGDVASDEEGLKTMQTLGVNMAWLLHKLHGQQLSPSEERATE